MLSLNKTKRVRLSTDSLIMGNKLKRKVQKINHLKRMIKVSENGEKVHRCSECGTFSFNLTFRGGKPKIVKSANFVSFDEKIEHSRKCSQRGRF